MPSLLNKSATQIRRNWIFALPVVIVIALILMLLNSLIRLNEQTKSQLSRLEQKFSLTVFLSPNADQLAISNLISKIERRSDVAAPVKFTSSEKALEFISKTFNLSPNEAASYSLALPSSISITPTHPDKTAQIMAFIQTEGANLIHESSLMPKTQESIANQMSTFLKNLRKSSQQIISIFTILFIIAGIFLIGSVISLGLLNKRKELYIMQLVGANEKHIVWPCLGEGAIIAISAFILNLFGCLMLNLLPESEQLAANILILEFVAILMIAVGTSFITTKLFLRD